jgi:ATP-dependent RNA helicase DDX19/DBP5
MQAEALPRILFREPNGKLRRVNLIGQAQHGSGKTGAYVLSMLTIVDEAKARPQALCVVPTRELAIQVHSVTEKLAQFTKIKCFLAVPGSERNDISSHIIVGTPGTLLGKLKGKEVGGCACDRVWQGS